MKRLTSSTYFISILFLFTANPVHAQSQVAAAFEKFAADPDLAHAIIGIKIIDAEKGSVIFEKNASTGLAPASCQKVITAATALELLGDNFRYETKLRYAGKIEGTMLKGNILIHGTGDPTLGSWRYTNTKENVILSKFSDAIAKAGIDQIDGGILAEGDVFKGESIPDGWIWQDIGNYYGAGAQSINWRENQFDLHLSAGSQTGDPVKIISMTPASIAGLRLESQATAAKARSGDNAYIYFPLNTANGYLRGTIPVSSKNFEISGALPQPARQMEMQLAEKLGMAENRNTPATGQVVSKEIYTHLSPPLDSIVYWFLKKSINLYGEALIKTLGETQAGYGSTDTGVNVIKRFWKSQDIDTYSLNIQDGSGLSPANRITVDALVKVMTFAQKATWHKAFFDALPVINGIHMKSGSIGGVLSYTGYVHAANGKQYTFAFIVNNYNGSGGAMRRKMWEFLDTLK